MKQNLPRGYSFTEVVVTVVLGVLFLMPLVRVVCTNYQEAYQHRQRQDVYGLNKAVEYYRLTGGTIVSHSLVGENSPEKIEAVVQALEDGFVNKGSRVKFINPLTSLKLSALTASGQGQKFTFKLIDNP